MKKIIKIFLLSFIAMIFIFSLANVVFGATTDITCKSKLEGGLDYKYPWCGITDLGGKSGLINTIYNYSLVLIGIVALGAIIYGGILYIMSAGNPSGQTEATGWITGAIWGLILLFGAALLFNTINPEIVSLKLPELEKVKIEGKNNIKNTKDVINYGGLTNYVESTGVCHGSENKGKGSETITCNDTQQCSWDNNGSPFCVSTQEKIKTEEAKTGCCLYNKSSLTGNYGNCDVVEQGICNNKKGLFYEERKCLNDKTTWTTNYSCY